MTSWVFYALGKLLHLDSKGSKRYCTISINSAGPVTRYTPAENLVSALWPSHRYIAQKIRQVTAGGPKIWGIQRGTHPMMLKLGDVTEARWDIK